MENIIRVTRKEKITSIRVTERTKKELEIFGITGDSHEEIIKKLIKLAKSTLTDSETKIIKNNNLIGTKYGRISRTFNIETEQDKYSIVCTFNDLSLMNLILENRNLQELVTKEWELDLEIVNISMDAGKYTNQKKIITWNDPKIIYENDRQEHNLLYLIAIKQVLEEMFDIRIYEITTQEDFFNLEKWRSVFLRNKLSMDSFYRDIQRKIK